MVRLKDQKLKQNSKCSSTPLSGLVFSHFHWYTSLSVIVWDHSFFRPVHRLFRYFGICMPPVTLMLMPTRARERERERKSVNAKELLTVYIRLKAEN